MNLLASVIYKRRLETYVVRSAERTFFRLKMEINIIKIHLEIDSLYNWVHKCQIKSNILYQIHRT